MGTAVAKIEPIPTVDAADPVPTPCWPLWTQTKVNALSTNSMEPKLPQSYALTSLQRAEIERHLIVLRRCFAEAPANKRDKELKRLFSTLASAAISADAAEIKTEEYRRVVRDQPLWAIRRAIDSWFDGETPEGLVKDRGDYDFVPSPARLRKLCKYHATLVRLQVKQLERLLAAKLEPEYSEEHRRKMLGKLGDANKELVREMMDKANDFAKRR